MKIWVFFRVFQKKFVMSISNTSTLGVPPPSLWDKNVDEDNESTPEQGKRTPTSAEILSGLVRSRGVKAKPKTVGILRNVRRKSCSKKDIVGAQNSHCCYFFFRQLEFAIAVYQICSDW